MDSLLVHDYLEKTVKNHPHNTAITDGKKSFSFQELDAKSDRLAGLLSDHGVTRGDRVVYYMDRRLECLTATLAILKAGGIYIPLDSKTPQGRLSQIIEDSKPKVILCDIKTVQKAIELKSKLTNQNFALISIDQYNCEDKLTEKIFFWEDVVSAHPIKCNIYGKPDDVAYILYTSGSTGDPKGVMVTHRNIRNYIDWSVHYFNITDADHILCTAPFYFDMSTFDIFCALSAGATLHLATGFKLLFPEHLARYIEDEQITVWKGVSSLLMYMCRAGVVTSERMATLQTVIFAGEPLAAQYLAAWMEAFPKVNFYNGYGPTEATGLSLCHHVQTIPAPGQKIPIGVPCKGARVVILDDADHPVSPGEIGELCISGDCLAKGYFNDPEKTSRLFTSPPPGLGMEPRMYRTGDLVQETPSGDYVFITRKDQQVKWMGYRIELGEIETKLLSHPDVKDAAVILVENNETNLSQLVAFFESAESILPQTLSQHLDKILPPYMVPKIFIQMECLPRNDRGKIARKNILDWYQGQDV